MTYLQSAPRKQIREAIMLRKRARALWSLIDLINLKKVGNEITSVTAKKRSTGINFGIIH